MNGANGAGAPPHGLDATHTVHSISRGMRGPPHDSAFGNTVFQFHSTQSVAAADRLDFWRRQFVASRIERARGFGFTGFDSNLIVSCPEHEVIFAELEGDPVRCYFGGRDTDIVLLGSVSTGVIGVTQGRDTAFAADTNAGILWFDCVQTASTVSLERYGMRYLALPRALVSRILGTDIASQGRAIKAVPTGPLGRAYARQLMWMGHYGPQLSEPDARAALALARALAVTILAGVKPQWRPLPCEFNADLLLTARHELADHIDDFNFAVAQLAATMNLSRAHLYRLFEHAGQPISRALQKLRMQRACRLLASHTDEPIGMVALHCGYTDLAAFGKAFRRRFGCTPTDYRHAARTGETGSATPK